MKLGILALDYDGTIAEDGALHPDVRRAIDDVRGRGIVVILVTGRILSDLRRVAGDLRSFDAVVAENGAVLAFPESGHALVLGHAPPLAFLEELTRRGVVTDVGACVVEANAVQAPEVLATIRDLELPLALIFNRSRLMVLPQGISKATGFREALRALRLSEHNAIAVGDAENDHALLEACERGVAVGWGSEALKTAADEVLEGTGPPAVAGYVRHVVAHERLGPPRVARRRLTLGQTADGQPVALAVQGRNVLIAGDPRSGKSWVAGLLCEQLILQRYCVCVIDPEGDYQPLQALPGVVTLGGEDPPPRPREVVRALRHPDVSVVIDLSKIRHNEKRDFVVALLPLLATLRRRTGLPHRIVVDEAHYFLHTPQVRSLLDLDLGGYTLVTYRAAQLHRDVLAASEAIILTRVSDPHEVRTLLALAGRDGAAKAWTDTLRGLSIQEAVLFPSTEEARGRLLRFRLNPRLTPHVRHRQKYLDVPVAERDAFVFVSGGAPTGQYARTLKEFTSIVSEAAPAVLDGHLRRGDFSRWIADVFGDYPLASRLQSLEDLYRLHQALDIQDAIVQLIEERYALGDGAA